MVQWCPQSEPPLGRALERRWVQYLTVLNKETNTTVMSTCEIAETTVFIHMKLFVHRLIFRMKIHVYHIRICHPHNVQFNSLRNTLLKTLLT